MVTAVLRDFRQRRRRTARRPCKRAVLPLLAGLLLVLNESVFAQSLINNGQIENTGTIRVKQQAIGLPPTVDGVFEFHGADQEVPARQYNSLALTGTGVKTTIGGSFGVTSTVTIAAPVVLDVQSGETLTLGGTLNEQGYLRGSISKTVSLSGGTTTSNFGQIGVGISWTGSAPGVTTVARTSGTSSSGNGNQSILRYYDIAPTFGSGLNSTIVFSYDFRELNGHDSSALELWRSTDNGLSWRRQGGVVNPALRTVTRTGVISFSRWTASDTLHLLGPSAYEWVASALALASGNSQQGPALSALSPFTVTVTDFFGNPIPNVLVQFSIQSTPTGATGQTLSADTARTNASGTASSVLTLGNVPGTYAVSASVTGLAGSPTLFTATAQSAASAMLLASGDAQADTIGAVLNPMSIRLEDASGNAVSGIPVVFRLLSSPSGQTGSALSDTSVLTNPQGLASTVLTLGSKSGAYTVLATTAVLPGREVTFNAQANHGAATLLTLTSGNRQSDTVRSVLDTAFVVSIADRGSNPVAGADVTFSIMSAPAGATGQSLSAPAVTTGAQGSASAVLTLGDRAGTYVVEARSADLPNQSVSFTVTAVAGAPAVLASTAGDGQASQVATALDTAFAIRVTDASGNPIQGVHVDFAISTVPAGAAGQALSTSVAHTDANGEASTVLTLGTKVGLYKVTASSEQVPGISTQFTARASAGAPALAAAVSGDGQTGSAGSALPQSFVVRVRDAFDNPVSGVAVEFSLISAPTSATGQGLVPLNAVTDSSGEASVVLMLGSYPGPYVVRASVSGLAAVEFTATATIFLADVNNNSSVDIADLTSIIDHVVGQIILMGVDSMRADVNRDGAINVQDAQVLVDHLLAIHQATPSIAPPLDPYQRPDRLAAALRGLAEESSSDPGLGELEITPMGLRLNLTNLTPVKAVRLFLRLRSPESVVNPDLVFKRAKAMNVLVNTTDDGIYTVSYNLTNTPIEAGSGSVFRLPLTLQDTSSIDSVALDVSVQDTLFDAAVQVPVLLKFSPDVYPTTFRLSQNYPNPFNNQTTIEYEIPDVRGRYPRTLVQVFNLLGEKVRTLASGELEAGRYVVRWDGLDASGTRVASGIYISRLISGDRVLSKKMVMIK